jgi:hypothetical protein
MEVEELSALPIAEISYFYNTFGTTVIISQFMMLSGTYPFKSTVVVCLV